MKRRIFITKLPMTSRGATPRRPRSAVRGDKQAGEADRVLPASHKSTEPVKAGHAGTSDPVHGPVRASAKERATEPMSNASLSADPANAEVGGRAARLCEASDRAEISRTGGVWATTGQPSSVPARHEGRNSHGVKSAPNADKRSRAEPGNLSPASLHPAQPSAAMTEATGDRESEGRSLRSSPRTGKPFTWRREAVSTASRQGVGVCPTR
jgi:hypothetical protein